jgi:hypothetical protein
MIDQQDLRNPFFTSCSVLHDGGGKASSRLTMHILTGQYWRLESGLSWRMRRGHLQWGLATVYLDKHLFQLKTLKIRSNFSFGVSTAFANHEHLGDSDSPPLCQHSLPVSNLWDF